MRMKVDLLCNVWTILECIIFTCTVWLFFFVFLFLFFFLFYRSKKYISENYNYEVGKVLAD